MNKRICTALLVLLAFTSFQVIAQHSVPADGRFNYNVRYDVKGLDFILRLRPVTYQFDIKKFERQIMGSDASYSVLNYGNEEMSRKRRMGFIAQDVEDAAISADFPFSGLKRPTAKKEHYGLSYESFVVPLVKSVQEQHEIILEQQNTIRMQQKKIELLDEQITSLSQKLDTILLLLEKDKE